MLKYNYTRQELYETLWKKSVTQLARELDIEAAQIRKICKHYSIPLPKSGYWSKLQFGKEIKIESMESVKEYDSIEINLKEPIQNDKDRYLTKLSIKTKEIKTQFPKESISSKKLSNVDPLIVLTGKYLNSSEGQRYLHNGKVRSEEGMIYIEVSKSLIGRALRFTNSFIRLCKLRGHDVIIKGWDTILVVEREEYKIKVREKCTRVITKVHPYKQTDLVPNGKLSLKIDYFYSSEEWSDTKTKSLENQLPKLVAAFELRAQKDIADTKERELMWAEEARLKAIEEKKQGKIRWENKKIEILHEHSAKWNKVQNLFNFIKEIEKQKNLSKKQEDWINWAKKEAESLNPLSDGIDELINLYEYNDDVDKES